MVLRLGRFSRQTITITAAEQSRRPGPHRAPQRYAGLQWPFGFFGSDTSLRSSAFSGATPTNLVCGLNQAPLLGRNVLK